MALFLASGLLIGTVTLFPYCYFGKSATECFLQMSDGVYGLKWQKLSLASQKYIILMIASMQKPIFYYGFVTVMDLNTYVGVSNSLNQRW